MNTFFPICKVGLIKAMCAIVIVIHHSSFYLPDSIFASVFRACGYLPVGIFLFISGYGLLTSLYIKENYLTSFLTKRMAKILVPAIISLLIYLPFVDEKISIVKFLEGELPFSHYWYIVIIITLYLLFFLVFSLIKSKKKAVGVTLMLLICYVVVSMAMGIGSYWYYTIGAYGGGILLALVANEAKYKSKFENFLENRKRISIVLFAIFVITTALKHLRIPLGFDFPGFGVALTLTSSLALPLLLCSTKDEVPVYKSWEFLSSVSYEMYLIHNLVVYGYNKLLGIHNIFDILVILSASVMASFIIMKLSKAAIRAIVK